MQVFSWSHRLLVHFRVAVIACLLCSISLSSWITPVSTASAAGNIAIESPAPNAVVGDFLYLSVYVSPQIPLATLQASVGELQTPLTPRPGCGTPCVDYRGTLDIRSLPSGAATAIVQAVDVDGGIVTASLPFIHDAAPTIDIVSPAPFAVAETGLDLDLSCLDDSAAGCTSLQVSIETDDLQMTIATGQNRIQQTVSLAEFEGQQVTLLVRAKDDRGQTAFQQIPVYVDNHPLLQKTDTVRGLILDSSEDRILYYDAYAHAIRIASRGQGTEEELPVKVVEIPRAGYLTSHGAIVEAYDATGRDDIGPGYRKPGLDPVGKLSLLEWRDGSLIRHGKPYERSLRVAGSYAVYDLANNPDQAVTTYRKVLEQTDSGETTVIEPSLSGYAGHDVNGDGVVAYGKSVGNAVQLFRYAPGDADPVQVTSDPAASYRDVRIDGNRMIALKTGNTGSIAGLVLIDDGVETVLPGTQRSMQPETDYLVRGGWTAYKQLTAQGQVQLWVRSPAGEEVKLSPTSTANSMFDALGPNGDVSYTYNGRLLLSLNDSNGRSEPADLAQAQAKAFWSGGSWHVRFGGSLYDVPGSEPEQPQLEGLAVEPSSLELPAGTTDALRVSAQFTDGSTRDVTAESTYESADPGVAAVSTDGHVDAVSEGSTVISVRYESLEANVPVQVIQDNPPDPGDPGNPNPEMAKLKALLRMMLPYIMASDLWSEIMDWFSAAGHPDALNEIDWE